MRQFDYASPVSIAEVLALLGRDGHGSVRPLAGGTDLLPLMKADISAPRRLVNIKDLPGLRDIEPEADGGLRIGGLTTLAAIEESGLVRERCPMLAEAVSLAATPQLRNMATLGGNLLQRPRCWYFRNQRIDCWLKGGGECPMRDGESQFAGIFDQSLCVAVHPSDAAPALVALDAEVHVRGPRGERALSVADLLQPPTEERRTESVLGPDELLIEVRIPPLPEGARGAYSKAMDRKVWAFALVGVAAVIRVDRGRIRDARLVLGGVANVPLRAVAAETELIGAEPSDERFSRAAALALSEAHPLRHNGYKVALAASLIRQTMQKLAHST